MTRYLSLAEFWYLAEHVTGINAATLMRASRVELADSALALDIVAIVDSDPIAGELGAFCQRWVELLNSDDEHRMAVQFRFDVGSNATERGGIFVPHVITAEGEQIDLFASEPAWPDTVDNLVVFVVPGAGPGSQIVFTVHGGLDLGI